MNDELINTQVVDDELQRTILGLKEEPRDIGKHLLGSIIYIIIFVIMVPLWLLKNKYYTLLTTYVPNVDMIATVLGYHGGPDILTLNNMWKYLYNPSNYTVLGFVSTTVINYFALLGLTFIVAWNTYKTGSWKYGWGLGVVMIILTYLTPGNIIVILQDIFGNYLINKIKIPSNTNLLYILVILFGLIIVTSIILVEAYIIRRYHKNIISMIETLTKYLYKLEYLEKLI